LLATSAALIFFNGVALLSPAFFLFWSSLFPWIVALASFSFILGVILGLVLVLALIMVLLGFRILAAFVILPTAILSLFIGGGFIVGVILGVIAALLIIIKVTFPFV